MIKLSIIVPIYNVEKYLSNCLDSLLDQDLDSSDYEIICINDGSPDACKTIVLAYQGKHSHIVFIDQENQGVSVARNKGLAVAKGTYITFVDPDDSIKKNTLKAVVERMERDLLDVLYLHIELYDEKGNRLSQNFINGTDGLVSDGFTHLRRTFPATIYRKGIITNIRFFKEIIRGQDTVFNAMVQAMASRCSYFSLPYYNYLDRNDSTRQFVRTEAAFDGFLSAITQLATFRKSHFPSPTATQYAYFDTALSLFVERILQYNLLPKLQKVSFDKCKNHLKNNDLDYLSHAISKRYPFFNRPYFIFYTYWYLKKVRHEILFVLSGISRKIKKYSD